MAKRVPVKYEPGELERVRRKLGPLTPEEATRIARALNGEVGAERTDATIEKRYGDLKYLKTGYVQGKRRKHSEQTVGQSLITGRPEPTTVFLDTADPYVPPVPERRLLPAPGYLDRVRTDFLASSPEYGIKSSWQAMISLLSFAVQVPDRVHSSFVAAFERSFVRTLDGLVCFTRDLCSEKHPTIHREIERRQFYHTILTVIEDWNIEEIRSQLKTIREHRSSVDVEQLGRMVAEIYRPLFILGNISVETDIGRALRRAFDVNMAFKPKGALSRYRLQDSYKAARETLPTIFYTLKRRLYPLLLKHVSEQFYDYDAFFRSRRPAILDFLNLSEADVLEPEPEPAEPAPPINVATSVARESKPVLSAQAAPDSARKGIECLELLFPQAGWSELDQWPDLYSYFQSIFRFPRGFELIARQDPLHQIMVLVSILGEMFQGFRNIEFAIGQSSNGESASLRDVMNGALDEWPLFIHEIVGNLYVPKLADYCRQLERAVSFRNTDLSLKMLDEMNWIKRTFFLPYHAFRTHFPGTGVPNRNFPFLHKTIRILRDALSAIASELEQAHRMKGECDSVLNPWQIYRFEIENPVSRRLDIVFREKRKSRITGKVQIVDKRSNANLIACAYSVVEMLHWLVNTPGSFYYGKKGEVLFRSVDEAGEVPEYAAAVRDVAHILSRPPRPRNRLVDQTEQRQNGPAHGNGFLDGAGLKERLHSEIEAGRNGHGGISILYVCVPMEHANDVGVQGPAEQAFQDVEVIIEGIVQGSALSFRTRANDIVVLLPRAQLDAALRVAFQIRDALKRGVGLRKGFSSSIGAVQWCDAWNTDGFLDRASQTAAEAASVGRSSIAYLDNQTETIEIA